MFIVRQGNITPEFDYGQDPVIITSTVFITVVAPLDPGPQILKGHYMAKLCVTLL